MNDDDLITVLREQRDKVPMTVPVEQIVRRSRELRARRLIPGSAGVLAVAVGVAIALTVVAPAGHPASYQPDHRAGHQPAVELAAWTVTKLANGRISVTIRELKDPAGLQRRLRADGVPASVTFAQHEDPACRPYPGGTPRHDPIGTSRPVVGTQLLDRVFPKPYHGVRPSTRLPASARTGWKPFTSVPRGAGGPPRLSPNVALIVIDPSALPSRAGVQIASLNGDQHRFSSVVFPTVVYASPECTGS
jgi:hypothetical protein